MTPLSRLNIDIMKKPTADCGATANTYTKGATSLKDKCFDTTSKPINDFDSTSRRSCNEYSTIDRMSKYHTLSLRRERTSVSNTYCSNIVRPDETKFSKRRGTDKTSDKSDNEDDDLCSIHCGGPSNMAVSFCKNNSDRKIPKSKLVLQPFKPELPERFNLPKRNPKQKASVDNNQLKASQERREEEVCTTDTSMDIHKHQTTVADVYIPNTEHAEENTSIQQAESCNSDTDHYTPLSPERTDDHVYNAPLGEGQGNFINEYEKEDSSHIRENISKGGSSYTNFHLSESSSGKILSGRPNSTTEDNLTLNEQEDSEAKISENDDLSRSIHSKSKKAIFNYHSSHVMPTSTDKVSIESDSKFDDLLDEENKIEPQYIAKIPNETEGTDLSVNSIGVQNAKGNSRSHAHILQKSHNTEIESSLNVDSSSSFEGRKDPSIKTNDISRYSFVTAAHGSTEKCLNDFGYVHSSSSKPMRNDPMLNTYASYRPYSFVTVKHDVSKQGLNDSQVSLQNAEKDLSRTKNRVVEYNDQIITSNSDKIENSYISQTNDVRNVRHGGVTQTDVTAESDAAPPFLPNETDKDESYINRIPNVDLPDVVLNAREKRQQDARFAYSVVIAPKPNSNAAMLDDETTSNDNHVDINVASGNIYEDPWSSTNVLNKMASISKTSETNADRNYLKKIACLSDATSRCSEVKDEGIGRGSIRKGLQSMKERFKRTLEKKK